MAQKSFRFSWIMARTLLVAVSILVLASPVGPIKPPPTSP